MSSSLAEFSLYPDAYVSELYRFWQRDAGSLEPLLFAYVIMLFCIFKPYITTDYMCNRYDYFDETMRPLKFCCLEFNPMCFSLSNEECMPCKFSNQCKIPGEHACGVWRRHMEGVVRSATSLQTTSIKVKIQLQCTDMKTYAQ